MQTPLSQLKNSSTHRFFQPSQCLEILKNHFSSSLIYSSQNAREDVLVAQERRSLTRDLKYSGLTGKKKPMSEIIYCIMCIRLYFSSCMSPQAYHEDGKPV